MAIKIMLDAGHVGAKYNAGAVKGYYESSMAWTLHNYLADELKAYGFTVGKTRKTIDESMDVSVRGKAAKGYDLLLSLHSNSADVSTVRRVACIYQTDDTQGTWDEVSKKIADKLAPVIADTMELPPDPGNGLRWKNYSKLAGGDRDGDGKKDDNYYGVLHGARMVKVPAVILEHSFHSNPETCRWLMNDDNLKKLAAAEAKCLADYYGMKKPEPAKPADPAPADPKPVTHTVVRGDTPEKIAKKYGITPAELIAANIGKYPRMTIDLIVDGWVLTIPAKGSVNPTVPAFRSYDATVTPANGLNVRKGPATNQTKLGALKCGTVIRILEEKNGWGRIVYQKAAGWVSLAYVKKR